MSDQATNMKNKRRQKQRTLAIILNRQLEFLHQKCLMKKLPNNEVFSPPFYKDEKWWKMEW